MTDPLRVRVVLPFGTVGGAERWLLRLLDATDRLSVDAVVLENGALAGELERRGVPVRVRPTAPGALGVALAAAALFRDLRMARPEVVLANGVKAAAVALPACVLTGVPGVWVKHDRSFDSSLARPLARLARKVVAVSAEIARPTCRDDAVTIPPARPDPPDPRPQAIRFWRDRGAPVGNGRVAAVVARLVPYKGIDVAVASLVHAPGWRLAIVGEEDRGAPGELERLAELARRLGVEDRVWFAGQVPEAGRRLAAFDAVLCPTRVDASGFGGEGFALVAAEAQAAGVPVVASRHVPGADHRHGAIRVGAEDPTAVGEALRILSDPAQARRRGAQGRIAVATLPSPHTAADRLACVLAEAALRPGGGRRDGPPLSLVTTVLDEGAAVDDLLQAVLPQLRADDEAVVVDGGSVDDTRARALRWTSRDPRVRLVDAPGTNIPAGRNAGVAEAGNDLLVFTDAGCTPAPRWADALRTAFAEPFPPALVTGVYRVRAEGAFQRASAAACYPDVDEARSAGPLVRAWWRAFGRGFDPTMPTGRSLAVTRRTWVSVGGFPERLAAAEDVTFGRAVASTGGRCLLHLAAEVEWEQRGSVRSTARMYRSYGEGDGRSRDPVVVARDLLRAAAYAAAPLAVARGGAARSVTALGATAYLGLPWRRINRRGYGLRAAALVPAALLVKDLSKALGCLVELARRHEVRGRS